MKLSKHTVEALSFGAKLLRQHHDNGTRFDLDNWISAKVESADWCGTTACACGLFGQHKWFQMRGLFSVAEHNRMELYDRDTGLLTVKDWAAVQEFFKLSPRIAAFLFTPHAYAEYDLPYTGDEGAIAVAKRIEAFLKKGEVPRKYLAEFGPGTDGEYE